MRRNTLLIVVLLFTIIFFNGIVGYCEDMQITKKIIIDIPSRTLELYQNNEVIKQYPVAVGKPYSQTPTGNYSVINKVINPYYAKKQIPGGSPRNPLGSRWIGFKPKYGIHGNSNPASIGTFASAGCVRMYERDVQELYDQVIERTSVIVQYELIKTFNDIKGENPILIVYPDYYSKENNLSDNVMKKLREIGIYEKIDNDKLNKINSLLNREKVVCSTNWTFFINDRYVTGDIIYDDDNFYIDKESLEQFFNINILSLAFEEKCSFLDYIVPEKDMNGNKYISLNSLIGILGGSTSINYDMETIQYNVNYLLLNNSLVSGEVDNLTGEPVISLLNAANLLNIKTNIVDGKIRFSFNGEEIQYIEKDGRPYLSVQTLKEKLKIDNSVHTLYGYVNLYKAPDIIIEDKVYKGRIVNDEIYIPYDMVIKELYSDIVGESYKITDDLTYSSNGINKIEVINIQNERYVNLKKLNKYVMITSNQHKTKIRLKRRNIL